MMVVMASINPISTSVGPLRSAMIFAPDSVCTYQDSDGGKGRHFPFPYRFSQYARNSFNSLSGLRFGATSCFISKPLALDPLKGNFGALAVIDAKPLTVVLPEIELSQVAVKMLGIDVLINADDAALEDREKPFKRVGMHVAARPFKLGVIDTLMFGKTTEFEVLRHVANEAAILAHHRPQMPSNATMIERDGANIAATFDKAQDARVMGAATKTNRPARLARARHFGFVGLYRFASAAQRANGAIRGHCFTDAMPKKPSRFHAAIEHPLNLARSDAFLGAAKQMDDLKPQMQRQMAVLKQRPHAHRERLLARVALVQSGTGRLAVKAANALGFLTMRTYGAIRPKPRLNVCEGRCFGQKLGFIQNRSGHG